VRTVRRLFFTVPTATMLLIGCDGRQPLAPSAPGDVRESAASNTKIDAPSNLTALSRSTSQIDIAWRDNATDEARFEIERASGPTAPFALLSVSVGANVTTYQDIGLQAATEYCYRVRAVRMAGKQTFYSTFSNVACASTASPPPPPPPPPPLQPTAVPVAATEVVMVGRTEQFAGQLSPVWVSWAHTGEYVAGFRVERSADAGASWIAVASVSPTLRSTEVAVAPEQEHHFRVIAFNTVGDAPVSNSARFIYPAAVNSVAVVAVDSQTANLTWQDNSAIEDRYEVWLYWFYVPYCGSSACNAEMYSDWVFVADLPANSTALTTDAHSSYSYGNAIYFVIARKNGVYSDAGSVTVPLPLTPAQLSGTSGTSAATRLRRSAAGW